MATNNGFLSAIMSNSILLKVILIFSAIVIVLGFLLFRTYTNLVTERKNMEFYQKMNEQNIRAVTDSISTVFDKKLKAWESTKDNYVLDKLEELEKYDKQLAKQLENVKGDVLAAIKTEAKTDLGGLTLPNELLVLNPTTNYYGLRFNKNYIDPGFEAKLSGISKFYVTPNNLTNKWTITPDSTQIDTLSSNIKITYGFKELNDKYQVFAISQSKKITFTDLTGGYFINKQIVPPNKVPKRWGIGPYVGYGVTISGSNPAHFGFNAGVGVHYDIFQFNFRKNKSD
jgi:hypothetical protein